MSVILNFMNKVTEKDPELRGKVAGMYRNIFESSATDINAKQIAAQPGTCQKGIAPNGRLDRNPEMPTDETVARLMKNSYAARFGHWCGSVSPGRTSLGMWGGTGPQNVNASTDSGTTN